MGGKLGRHLPASYLRLVTCCRVFVSAYVGGWCFVAWLLFLSLVCTIFAISKLFAPGSVSQQLLGVFTSMMSDYTDKLSYLNSEYVFAKKRCSRQQQLAESRQRVSSRQRSHLASSK